MEFRSLPPASSMPISTPSAVNKQPILVSRFSGLSKSVVKQIENSPQLQQPHIQQLLQQDTLEIRFQGKPDNQAEIVTAGKAPQKYILDGVIRAALVNLGLSGKQVIPQDVPEDIFVHPAESRN